MQSRGAAARGACCRANSPACAHCLLVNDSGILREHLLFAYGALSNESRGLGERAHKEPRFKPHTHWDRNDGGEPLAEENHQSIEVLYHLEHL